MKMLPALIYAFLFENSSFFFFLFCSVGHVLLCFNMLLVSVYTCLLTLPVCLSGCCIYLCVTVRLFPGVSAGVFLLMFPWCFSSSFCSHLFFPFHVFFFFLFSVRPFSSTVECLELLQKLYCIVCIQCCRKVHGVTILIL